MRLKTILLQLLLMAFAVALFVGSWTSFLYEIVDFKDNYWPKLFRHYTVDESFLEAIFDSYGALDSSPPLKAFPPFEASPRLNYSRLHCARFETGDNAGSCHCYSRQGMRLDVPDDVCNSRVGHQQQSENIKNMEIINRRWN